MSQFSTFDDGPKKLPTKTYPVNAETTSALFRRVEPFLTPKLLKKRYLKGVEGLDYSSEELKDEINLAANEIETELKVDIFPVEHRERHPFDRSLYREYVYIKAHNSPILEVKELLIESSDGRGLYRIPAAWLEMGNAHRGQLNLIPLLSIFGAVGLQSGSATDLGTPTTALIFLRAIQSENWLPGFFTLIYTSGLCNKEGQLPIVVNDLIGLTTAIEILSNMQNRNINSSQSISQDGIAQSSSSAGTQIYEPRIKELKEKRDKKLQRVRSIFSQKYFINNI